MKPQIIIDTLSLLGSLSGVGRYSYEVSKALLEFEDYQTHYFYGYFSKTLLSPQSAKSTKSLRALIIKNPLVKSIVRGLMFRICGAFSHRYDLYWQPNFIPNGGIKAQKIVTTVHDFSWEIYPEFQPKERVKYFKKYFYSSLQGCDHIITGSKFTKDEIMERTGIAPEKISVIYHGIDHTLFYPKLNPKKQKYILSVGSIEPRKNLKNLLLAYSLLDTTLKDDYHLLLVGGSGWENAEIMALITKLDKWVHYSGFVSDEELSILYSGASLFVYPSLYEGFGIPPLEAMACGAPVIVSNVSSLPEVCLDAAFYVNPLDIEAIKEGMVCVLKNTLLREEFIVKGLARAKEFSWEKSAREHQGVFGKVLFKG